VPCKHIQRPEPHRRRPRSGTRTPACWAGRHSRAADQPAHALKLWEKTKCEHKATRIAEGNRAAALVDSVEVTDALV